MKKANKPTLEELEGILNSGEDVPIEILPNGEITTKMTTYVKYQKFPVLNRFN